uniref:Uncharacterized protein n=1 Tax=Knipowitschia caucasica TaxID=637954 RepID=A0AAV2M0Q6_KNICA
MGATQRWRRPCALLPLLLLCTQAFLDIPRNLPAPPVLLVTPESFTAFSPANVVLPCEANGNPTPTFRWVKDGEVMDLELIGDGTLRADANDSLDMYHGAYRCYASNTLGTAVTQTVHVIVERHPVIQKQQKTKKRAFEGESLVLTCNPPESSTPPHIHWMDRKMVHIKLSERVTAGLDGNLYFSNLLKSDSRSDYTCNAQYLAAMTVLPETTVALTVTPSNSVLHGRKPRLFTPSGLRSSVLTLRGNSLTLECIPSGLPTPKVEWIKKDGRLQDTTAEVSNYGRWLHFESVELSDDGEYQCRAYNEHGETRHAYSITVEAAPYWVKEPQNLMYAPGENVRLDCQAEGIPTPTVRWTMNGLPMSQVDPEPRRSVSGSVLRLLDVEVSDTAVFQCEAQNKHGSILLNTYINVVDDMDGVKSELTDAVKRIAYLETKTEHLENRGRRKNLRLVGLPESPEKNMPMVEYVQHMLPIWRGLDTSRTFALEMAHRILAKPRPGPNRAVIIRFTEMEKRLHNGQGFMYKVWWREAGKKDQRWNSNSTNGPPFVVTGSGTYTPFEIKVQAVNAIGDGPVPEAEIGHSGEDVPLEAPGGVTVRVMNSTIRVKWNEAQNVRGLLLGYKIYLRKQGPKAERRRRSLEEVQFDEHDDEEMQQEEEMERVVEVRGMRTSEEITGLKLYSIYHLSITAFNSKGQGPPSAVERFETPEGAPGPPALLTSDSSSDTSLVLVWTPPVETNGILLGYIIQYQQEEGGDLEYLFISDPSTTHTELQSLNSSSYYLFSVRGRTAAGDGPAVRLRAATQLDGVPPSNVTMYFGDTYLNLSWVPGPREGNHGFHIHYLTKSAGAAWRQSELVNSSQGFYTLSGLEPGTTYHLLILHHNSTQWEQIVQTKGPELSEMPGGFATQGWFIGLISAIILLVLILLILCLIKRRKGGKYAVKDKEDKEVDCEARPMKDETFGEYRSLESDGDEKRSDSQPSLCPSKASDDSLAEYGDSVDIQFNEDGSFIGQYSGRGAAPNESSGPASPMATSPPPPIPLIPSIPPNALHRHS